MTSAFLEGGSSSRLAHSLPSARRHSSVSNEERRRRAAEESHPGSCESFRSALDSTAEVSQESGACLDRRYFSDWHHRRRRRRSRASQELPRQSVLASCSPPFTAVNVASNEVG